MHTRTPVPARLPTRDDLQVLKLRLKRIEEGCHCQQCKLKKLQKPTGTKSKRVAAAAATADIRFTPALHAPTLPPPYTRCDSPKNTSRLCQSEVMRMEIQAHHHTAATRQGDRAGGKETGWDGGGRAACRGKRQGQTRVVGIRHVLRACWMLLDVAMMRGARPVFIFFWRR